MNKHCLQFEATEENKLIYTDIFKQYQELIETYLLKGLTEAVEDFSMEEFMEQIKVRKDEIDEPLMDTLLSLSEFESFKEMMLFARAHYVATTPKMKSGKAAALGLSDKPQQAKQPEGEMVGEKMEAFSLQHFESNIHELSLTGKATKIFAEEQEDGEARPDLNLDIIKLS